jgi:hypothetical protein
MSARTRRAKKPFARVGQSITAVVVVEEAALQLVFKRLDVARHRCVFRAEQRGCIRKRPRSCDCQSTEGRPNSDLASWFPSAAAH